MPSNHERDMLRLLKEVNDLKQEVKDLKRIFPRNLRGSDFIARRSGFEFERRAIRQVSDGGDAGDHLESNGDGTYDWAETREVPAGGAAGTHLESDGAEGYDWAVTREVPITAGLDGRYLVDQGDGTYHWRIGSMAAAIYEFHPFTITSTPTRIPLVEILDTLGIFTSVSGLISIPLTGFIRITFEMELTTTTNNTEISLEARVNGNIAGIFNVPTLPRNEQYLLTLNGAFAVLENDLLEFELFWSGGGDADVTASFVEVLYYRTGALSVGSTGAGAQSRR